MTAEWIVVDPGAGPPWDAPMPFARVRCSCSEHLVCTVFRWGRCGRCGEHPTDCVMPTKGAA